MKPVTPDEILAKVVGAAPLPRTELTKKLWEYIRKHGLRIKTRNPYQCRRADLKRYISKQTQKRPLIMPVILEI